MDYLELWVWFQKLSEEEKQKFNALVEREVSSDLCCRNTDQPSFEETSSSTQEGMHNSE